MKKILDAKVNYVKNLTIHSYHEMIWNENCDRTIEEYFKNPSYTVLTIFFDGNQLNATLAIPTCAFKGFTYFLRSPWQVYTPENFLNTVSFGSINDNVKSNVLKFMENLYAPIVLHSDEYASFLRNDVFLNLHEFIVSLTEEIYKPMDRTTLYVPKERLLQTFSKVSNRNNYFLLGENQTTILSEEEEGIRKLVGRLEKVVWFWIRQMRRVTTISIRKKIDSIQDEVNYWNTKHSNLNHLRGQLLNPEVQLILNILKDLHSPCASKLEEIITHIDTGLKESSSNLLYLNILLNFCKNLNLPEDTDNSLTEALLLILFVWTESPFYSTTNNMEILCQALSSQIMHRCQEYIKLDVALGNNPELGIQMLEKSIRCCNIYETSYDNIMINVTPYINFNKNWDVNRQEVFNKIDTFKQRCYDLIEICKALIVFGRCDKMRLIGGPKGIECEAYWREIESLFYKSLNQIIMARDIVFDITKFTWLRKIREFRYMVLQVENMAVTLINDIFESVKNVEEGVEAIYALQKFKSCECLQKILRNKWIQVWKIFSNEIEQCYISIINQPKEKTDISVNLLCISRYLKYQHSIIMNALYWIGDSDLEKCVLQQYEHVLDVIDEGKKDF
ncbi:uncharacterized protein LOC143428883 isoform X2 [Xylocopa sonorina]|uniref:uncharacterized protein LOC143428883 isoform X2 n=1 Tax=Xylocopa sonorina TaxID=1818115 RepID=UPI00403AD150